MSDVPAGFAEVLRKGGRNGPADGVRASVQMTSITFSGIESFQLPGRIRVATDGSQFAIADGDQFTCSIRKDGYRTMTNPQKSIPVGRYAGHREGDWWVFEPVSE